MSGLSRTPESVFRLIAQPGFESPSLRQPWLIGPPLRAFFISAW